MNFEIIKAQRENSLDIKNLMLVALKEDPFGFGASFDEYNRNSEYWWFSYLEPYISGDKDVMFLAKDGNKVVAMAGLLYENKERKKHVGLVAWVYVLKEYRRKGLAKDLMDKIIAEAKDIAGLNKLTLFVNSTQVGALELYKKYGFEVSGTLKQDLKIGDDYVDTMIMELFLK